MKCNQWLFAAACIALSMFACKKASNNSSNTGTGTTTKPIAPTGFNYSTTKNITVTASALTTDSKPIGGVTMKIYTLNALDSLDKMVFKGVTDQSGHFSAVVSVPVTCDTLVIDPAFFGLLRLGKVPVPSTGGSVNAIFGGPTGYGGDITAGMDLVSNLSLPDYTEGLRGGRNRPGLDGYISSSPTKLVTAGSFNILGVPGFLTSPSDIMSATFMQDMNAALPETVNEPNRNPALFTSTVPNDIVVTQASDVWLTFAYEGAGFYSSLGWYQYPTGKPPATINNIDSIHFVYANCKYTGNGGGLASGNKVHLGTFAAGTTIGLVLFANAWAGSFGNINYYSNQGDFFTDSWLNPETVPSLQQHTILLQYQNLTLICFEDLNRQNGGCDNDFNDVIVYASSNPITAIAQPGVTQLQAALDTDGDGVPDYADAFPTDATRAYINYYPAQNQWGTLAYEDNWPALGDYDLNDLVVSYQYKVISNAQNNIVEFYGSYAPVASGATFNNGFGVQFPFSSSLIKTVTGQNLQNNYIKQNANGTEAGQTNAVVIPFDNVRNLIKNADGNLFVNTLTTEPKITGDTSVVYVSFTSPVSSTTLGMASFNPFLISNLRRGYEVHLPNYAPTSLATTSFFGTQNDASVPASNIYYVTKDNHPWALSFIGPWQYPIEGDPINEPYLHFYDWAASGGVSYTDWYYNTSAGYQNTQYIYSK